MTNATTTSTRQLVGMTASADLNADLNARCRWAYAVEALATVWGEEIEISQRTVDALHEEADRLQAVAEMLGTLSRNLDDAEIAWGEDAETVIAPGGQALSRMDQWLQIGGAVAADRAQQLTARDVYLQAAERIEGLLETR